MMARTTGGAAPSFALGIALIVAGAPLSAGQGRPIPREAPAAASGRLLPPGPVSRSAAALAIDYELAAPARTLVLEILDAKQEVLRTFTGADETTGATVTPAGDEDAPHPGRPPSLRAGRHRFWWDLRYAPAPALDPGSAAPVAALVPAVLPGSYIVRLTVDAGRPLTAPLTVTADAATATGDSVLKQRVEVALAIRDQLTRASQAVLDIRALKAQIAQRLPDARSPAVGLAADVVRRKLTEVEEMLGPPVRVNAGLPPDGPTDLAGQLISLGTRWQASPEASGATDLAECTRLASAVDTAFDRLRGVLANEVRAFNVLLTNGGLQPLDLPATLPKPNVPR